MPERKPKCDHEFVYSAVKSQSIGTGKDAYYSVVDVDICCRSTCRMVKWPDQDKWSKQ